MKKAPGTFQINWQPSFSFTSSRKYFLAFVLMKHKVDIFEIPSVYDMHMYCAQSLSNVQLFATHGLQTSRLFCPWGFPRQEYWNGLPCPPPGDLPNPDIEPRSPALQVDSLLSESPGKLIFFSFTFGSGKTINSKVRKCYQYHTCFVLLLLCCHSIA